MQLKSVVTCIESVLSLSGVHTSTSVDVEIIHVRKETTFWQYMGFVLPFPYFHNYS